MMMLNERRWLPPELILLLLVYCGVAGWFALRTPAWQAPDEPAHYNYVAQVANNGCCPLIVTGDWDAAYLERLKAERFAPALLTAFATIQYEDHQPPLYYLLQAVVFRLFSGQLIALRLFSVLCGAVVVYTAWQIGRMIWPTQRALPLAVAALSAFLPQHVAMLAAVNNDALAEALVGLLLWGALALTSQNTVAPPTNQVALLGGLMGLALLTKLSTLALLLVLPLAVFLQWRTLPHRPLRPLVRALAVFWGVALALGGLWWLRNSAVYGFPDVFGLRAHDAVVVGQPRTADFIAQHGWSVYLQTALQTTFNSFWGQFGWMALPLWGWLYTLLAALCVLALVGLLLAWPPRWRAAVLVLLSMGVLALLQYVYYNTSFQQFQGRYLFVGLTPLAVGCVAGLARWGQISLRGRWPAAMWSIPALIALLIPLDVYLVARVIEPLLRP